MSGQPAARVGDLIACSLPQTVPAPLPHAPFPGLPILPAGEPSVVIGGQPAARMGDRSLCVTPAPVPNPIAKGAFCVPIGKMPAARKTDSATHPGSSIAGPCCSTVEIGLAGTAGNVFVGTQMCQLAANGRTSGSTAQSTNNCGLESSRQIMNQATGGNVSEAQLLGQATAQASPTSPVGTIATANGGTWPSTQAELLTGAGVPAAAGPASSGNVALAMSQGRGAIANVDAGALWPTTHGINPGTGSWHAVTVTGVEVDDTGKIVAYHINDTGPNGGPNCGVRVGAATFEGAMGAYHTPSQGLVSTTNAIW